MAERWQLDPAPLGVGLALYGCVLLLGAYLWHRIVLHLAGRHPFWRGAQVYAVAMAVRRVPGAPWGVVSRVYTYHKAGYSWGLPLTASVLEVGASGLAGVALSGLLLAAQPGMVPASGWLGVVLAIAASPLLLHTSTLNRALRALGRVANPSFELPETIPLRSMAGWVGISAVVWLLRGIVLFCVIVALAPVQPAVLPVLRALVIAGSACILIIFLPSGFGVLELLLAALLSADLPQSTAVAAPLVTRLLTTMADALFAGLAVLFGNLGDVKGSEPQHH